MKNFLFVCTIVLYGLSFSGCRTLSKLGLIPNELEMATGLKGALEQGLFKSFDQFANPKSSNILSLLKLPGEMDKIQNVLQTLGVKTDISQITQKLTSAMSTAMTTAKPVFMNSLKHMSIRDAAKILVTDNPHSATDYFKRTATDSLTRAFVPIVDSTVKFQEADKEYKQIASVYNALPFINKPLESNISGFIAGRAIDGMFAIIAQEEAAIRSKYQLRKTDLMRKVFNYAEQEIKKKYNITLPQ